MTKVVADIGVSFGSAAYDPMSIVKGLLAGSLFEADRRSALTHWWNAVDGQGIRNLEHKDALTARLAVCLLTPNEGNASDLGEQLSWFLEVLGFLGVDVDKAIEVMERHFPFI